jgi:(p)ppGpp synthase/HD superfamily hydrolase
MDKLTISMRYWLYGKGYYKAVEAMEFAAQYHKGFRKDGVTPEFSHQISIAHYVRTLPGLMYEEDTLATVFLHDVREDYDVEDHEIRARFGNLVADGVDAMTKTFRGVKRAEQHVFDTIARNPIASIAKGADRIHNFQTMVGVFSVDKQKVYVDEGREFFLPMLKTARRMFPRQEPAYENIKHMLRTQMDLVKAIHAAAETGQV